MALIGLGAVAVSLALGAAERLDADPATVGALVEGCSASCADAYTHALAERLARVGLRLVAPPPAGAPVVQLRLEIVDTGDGVQEGQERLRARAALRLLGGDNAGAIVAFDPVLFEAESESRDTSLLKVALASLDMSADDVVASILALAGIEPPESATALERSDAMRRARRDLPARAAAIERFQRRCRDDSATLALPTEDVSCVARCASELRSVRAADGESWIQLRRSAWAVPISSPNDVQRLDLPGELARWPDDAAIDDASDLVSYGMIASEVDAASGSRDGIFAFVAHREGASALVFFDGAEHVLARVDAPRVFVRPAPSPSGRWVAVLNAEHARGVAHLSVVRTTGGTLRDLFTYAEDLRWVEHDGRELLWVRVSGADEVTSPLTRSAVVDAGMQDDEYEDEPGDFALVEEGDALAPPGPYAVLLDPENGEVLARVGGREQLVRGLVGLRDGRALATYSTTSEDGSPQCGLLSHDLVSGEETPTPTPICLISPMFLPDGSIVASAVASRAGDPSPTDREIVVLSTDGTLELLTSNDTDDLEPSPVGPHDVAFTRRLPTRYARFPRSAACRATRSTRD